VPEGSVPPCGTPSHGPGDHEFNAGVKLIKECLDRTSGIMAAAIANAAFHATGVRVRDLPITIDKILGLGRNAAN